MKYRALALFLLIAVAIVFLWQGYRKVQIDRVYSLASEEHALVQSSEAENAVLQLTKYRGAFVTELLLNIALSAETGHRQRIAAIQSMHKRGGAEEAAALATLIQPHQSLDLRRVVAQTIELMPCDARCLAAILHYLERIYLGQPNYEDLRERLLQSNWEKLPRRTYEREQEEIYQLLENSLKRQRSVTLNILVQTYALGSDFPSPFALELAARIHLDEACPYLIRARRVESAIQAPHDPYLEHTTKSLGCPEQ